MVIDQRKVFRLEDLEAILSKVADGKVGRQLIMKKTGFKPKHFKNLVAKLTSSGLLESINGERFSLTMRGWEFIVHYGHLKKILIE